MTPITITIQRPQLAKRLAENAKQQGLDVTDYAQHLLENTLQAQAENTVAQQSQVEQGRNEQGESEGLAVEEFVGSQPPIPINQWLGEFDAWVDSHPQRSPLPEAAFERESFYPQEWREQAA